MTPIQYAIARVAARTNAPRLVAIVDQYRNGKTNPGSSMSTVRDIVKQTAGVPVTPPPPSRDPAPAPRREPAPKPSKTHEQVLAEEAARMAIIEGERETRLIREAEREAAIARCQREIRAIEQRPADVDEKAYLVALGVEDWRAELRIIEREGV
jgi:hypothetical protein